jgi:hypothetical protein
MIKVTVPIYRSADEGEQVVTIADGEAFDIRGVTNAGSVLVVIDSNSEEVAVFNEWRYALWEENPTEPVVQPQLLMGKLIPDAA